MSTTSPPDMTAHYCGRCGCWHQGALCADQLQPQPGMVTIINPTLTEDDVRRIVREELANASRRQEHRP